LLNDLLDLSKIEAGKLDLTFASVDLTRLRQQCVAIMQPQANRERIIIRTSLLPTLPAVVVDERSIRQIVLNLLSNSIKFTGAGGQVIVSTALTERGEAVLRVRDTGIGMSEKEIETALEPFRQIATSTRWGSGGTGPGLAPSTARPPAGGGAGRASRPAPRDGGGRFAQRRRREIPAAARRLCLRDHQSAGARCHPVRTGRTHRPVLPRMVGRRLATAGDRLDAGR